MELLYWIAGPFLAAFAVTWFSLRAFVRRQQVRTNRPAD